MTATSRSRSGGGDAFSASLTIEVAGEWSSGDFGAFFGALDRLYVTLYRFRRDGLPVRREQGKVTGLGRITRAGVPPLSVDAVRYASPGAVSLLGVGEIIEQLRELIKDLWGRNRQEKATRALELEARRDEVRHGHRMRDLEYLRLRAAVAQEMWEAGEAAVVPRDELEGYLRRGLTDAVESLDELVASGQLTAVRLRE